DGRRHTASGAHRHQAALQIAALELVENGTDQDCPGGADRVAQSHRTAIDVDFVAIEIEIANVFFRDHRERFVDFEQVDIVDGEPGLSQYFARGGNRSVQHQRRAITHVRHCHD